MTELSTNSSLMIDNPYQKTLPNFLLQTLKKFTNPKKYGWNKQTEYGKQVTNIHQYIKCQNITVAKTVVNDILFNVDQNS